MLLHAPGQNVSSLEPQLVAYCCIPGHLKKFSE